MTDSRPVRPITVMIAALGGEGGGVLTAWIVNAAERAGLKVQNTSIPGVAQRTGATTYYIELLPEPADSPGGREPVLSLYPGVGDIDVMVASELVEAGRAIQSGYVSPDRTTLIAATHRVYAIGERGAMADGRFDGERIVDAARQRSRRFVLGDFDTTAAAEGASLNAVLLGVIAANADLPIARDRFEDAIREQGIAVAANLRGFEAGFGFDAAGTAVPAEPSKRSRKRDVGGVEVRARAAFPEEVHDIVVEGVRRLVDYQGARYAALYLDRLKSVLEAEQLNGGDMSVTRETARHLALWMSYEDVIRVAQLKTRADRYNRVLEEVKAKPGEPVSVTEFLKPGIEELCSVLPGFAARPILRLGERRGWLDRAYVGMTVRTTSVTGFLRLWVVARLRPWRPRTYRFGEEQKRIETWLSRIRHAVGRDPDCALELAACAGLLKGYGDTYRRGSRNFERIVEAVADPALAGAIAPAMAADAIANARAAALADPTGKRLDAVIEAIRPVPMDEAAE